MCIHHTVSCKFVLLCDASASVCAPRWGWSLNKQPWQTSAHRHLCGCVTVLQGCLIILCSTSLVTLFWLYCMNNHKLPENYSLPQQWFSPTKSYFLNITKSFKARSLNCFSSIRSRTGLNGVSFILDNMQVKIFCATNIEMRFGVGWGRGAIKHHLTNVTCKFLYFSPALREDSWMKWRSAERVGC